MHICTILKSSESSTLRTSTLRTLTTSPQMKRTFIYDMNAVIVDSKPTHKIALKQFCKEHGYDLSENDLRERIYGRTNRDWLVNLLGELDEDTIRSYADEKESLFRKLYTDIHPLKGLTAFLEKV